MYSSDKVKQQEMTLRATTEMLMSYGWEKLANNLWRYNLAQK